MTPWDHAYDEAHGIANLIGCADVNDIARALLAVDEVEASHRAEAAWRWAGDQWSMDTRQWWRVRQWEKDEWREAALTVMGLQMPAKHRRLPRRRRPLPRRLLPPERKTQWLAIEESPPWPKRDNVMSLSQFEGTTAFKMRDEWR